MTKEKNTYFFNCCLFGLLFFSVFSSLHCGLFSASSSSSFLLFSFSHVALTKHQLFLLFRQATYTLEEPLNSWLSLDVSPISTVFRLSRNLGLNSLKLALTFFDRFLDFLIVYWFDVYRVA